MALPIHRRNRVGNCANCPERWPCATVQLEEAKEHLKAADDLSVLVEDARTALLHGSMASWAQALNALFTGLDAYYKARGTAPAQAEAAEAST